MALCQKAYSPIQLDIIFIFNDVMNIRLVELYANKIIAYLYLCSLLMFGGTATYDAIRAWWFMNEIRLHQEHRKN